MIRYTDDVNEVDPAALEGFFVGWPKHPDPETHARILCGSSHVWLAFDERRCVGFINALSDGVLSAYIPLLEVLPAYQGRGIGDELVRRMVGTLERHYSLDLVCDPALTAFYARHGFKPYTSMVRRHYERQAGDG